MNNQDINYQYQKLKHQYNDLLQCNDDLVKALNKSTNKKYDVALKELEFKKQQYRCNIILKLVSVLLVLVIYIIAMILIFTL